MLFVATLHVKHLSPSSETVSIAIYRRCRGCLLSTGCGIAVDRLHYRFRFRTRLFERLRPGERPDADAPRIRLRGRKPPPLK